MKEINRPPVDAEEPTSTRYQAYKLGETMPEKKNKLLLIVVGLLLLVGVAGAYYFLTREREETDTASDGTQQEGETVTDAEGEEQDLAQDTEVEAEGFEEDVTYRTIEYTIVSQGTDYPTNLYIPQEASAEYNSEKGAHVVSFMNAELRMKTQGDAAAFDLEDDHEVIKTEDENTLIRYPERGTEDGMILIAVYATLLTEDECEKFDTIATTFCAQGGSPFIPPTTSVMLYVPTGTSDAAIKSYYAIFDEVMKKSAKIAGDPYEGWRDYSNKVFGITLKLPEGYATEEFIGKIRIRHDNIMGSIEADYEELDHKLEIYSNRDFIDNLGSLVNNGVIGQVEIDGGPYDITEYEFSEGVPNEIGDLEVNSTIERIILLPQNMLIRIGIQESYVEDSDTKKKTYAEQPTEEEVKTATLIIESIRFNQEL